MRTSNFTPEQMEDILRQGESGVPVVEVCRQHGFSEAAGMVPWTSLP
jgi:transposase-like protein